MWLCKLWAPGDIICSNKSLCCNGSWDAEISQLSKEAKCKTWQVSEIPPGLYICPQVQNGSWEQGRWCAQSTSDDIGSYERRSDRVWNIEIGVWIISRLWRNIYYVTGRAYSRDGRISVTLWWISTLDFVRYIFSVRPSGISSLENCMLEAWQLARIRWLRLLSTDSTSRGRRETLQKLLISIILVNWPSNNNRLPVFALPSCTQFP